jgi:hypothetical protein
MVSMSRIGSAFRARAARRGAMSALTAAVAIILVTCGAPARAAADPPGRLRVLGLSLLFPGLGHRALGYQERSTALMTADAAIWTGFVTFRLQGGIRRDGYVEMAKTGAGVERPAGHSDEYYRLLGSYYSSEAYDDEIRRDARARYPYDLQARATYFEQHRVTEGQRWEWASSAEWRRYRDKRGDSLHSIKRSHYMLGLAVANRLVAAVDALRLVHRRGQEPALGLFLSADPLDPTAPALVGVSYRLP